MIPTKPSALAWMMLLSLAALPAAHAQTPPADACPTPCSTACSFGEELVNPYEIPKGSGGISTTLQVQLQSLDVPVWLGYKCPPPDGAVVYQCCKQTKNLRSYTYPSEGASQPRIPGPTLRLRKGTITSPGDTLQINLINQLPASEDGECTCSASSPMCKSSPPAQCCSAPDKFPNCMHGDNTTNLHFHGMHVSPQGYQDNVLVEVQPQSSPSASGGHHAAHLRGTQVTGNYPYSLDPIRWDQSEGTHWYHPHKHGATALQVANGMAGALIVEGPFDDWLKSQYPSGLEEKILVIQQILETVNLFQTQLPSTLLPPAPLVNGMVQPTITMCPGEIQRWRLINATMQGSAQLAIDFDSPSNTTLHARQIAMDGIRFSPENYVSQPYLTQDVNQDLKDFQMSPGNRADFLVQAPAQTGTFAVTYDVFGHVESPRQRQVLDSFLEFLGPGDSEPSLLTVTVSSDGCGQPMSFPTSLLAMPEYLKDIGDDEVVAKRDLFFDLLNPTTSPPTPVLPGNQPSQFYINLKAGESRQFDPSCVDITTTLDTAEQWTIHNSTYNSGLPFHVFHIHTNPFQVMSTTGAPPGEAKNPGPCQTVTFTNPVWQDSITLPSPCIPTGKNVAQPGQVVIRQRYQTFTGEYVLHCHFLAHEDRGMMLAVQTVCPTTDGSLVFSNTGRNVVECAPGFTPQKAATPCPPTRTPPRPVTTKP